MDEIKMVEIYLKPRLLKVVAEALMKVIFLMLEKIFRKLRFLDCFRDLRF